MTIPIDGEPGYHQKAAPRAAVVAPYWDFWESSVGPDFRKDRENLLRSAVDLLRERNIDVVWQGLVDGPEQGVRCAAEAAGRGPEAVLVLQSMAVPPSHALGLLDHLPQPVVIWAVQRSAVIPADFNAGHITSLGATVGTPMITNMLHRTQKAFELVVSPEGSEQGASEVADRLRAAAVATRLRRARLARVGRPLDGYGCVDADDAELERSLGIEVVALTPLDVLRHYAAVDDTQAASWRQRVVNSFEIEPGPEDDLDRSLRLAAALEALDREGDFAAGAMNCHVPEIRFGRDPGLTPCFGLGCETTRGVPWTCTGDVLTAVAMLVAKQLSGAALYHEIEAIDFKTGEVAVANSGEHDLDWCPEGRVPKLGPNPWYGADERTGYRAHFELPTGPASLVGFAPRPDHPSGFGFVVAEGEITGRELPANPTVGCVFRFSNGSVAEAWTRWTGFGVNHHSAISPGHLASAVAAVANFAHVDYTVV